MPHLMLHLHTASLQLVVWKETIVDHKLPPILRGSIFEDRRERLVRKFSLFKMDGNPPAPFERGKSLLFLL